MLERVDKGKSFGDMKLIRFSSVERYQSGTGCCLVYNAVLKKTRQGKPFVTLYLRDYEGVTLPGYIFDIASPLLAGGEAVKVIGKVVEIDWQENYLNNIGLTLLLDRVAVVHDAPLNVQEQFNGVIPDIDRKEAELKQMFQEALHFNVSFPAHVRTYSSPDYMQGRVGGLAEYYYRVGKVLESTSFLPQLQRSNLIATFAIYLCVHAAYVRASDSGEADITLVTTLTSLVGKLSNALKVGPAALEVVHMFFGYEPKDIYVRTVTSAAKFVQQADKEFSLYRTIPLLQEGDAGYGAIHRYKLDDTEKK